MKQKSGSKKKAASTENSSPLAIKDLGTANRLLESFFQIVQATTAPRMTFEGRLDHALQAILVHLGVEQGSIMLLENKKLVVKAASRKELINCRQSLSGDSVAVWVAKNKKPLFIADITNDKRFNKRADTYKKDALISAPIMQNSRLAGVINVSDKSGQTNFLQDDISFLLDFSALIFSIIIQGNLAEKIKNQRNTLRKRNRELKRQEDLRSNLSRMLIHDLKGPLSEVMANLDIMSYSISEENKEFVEAAQTGCDKAVRMAENLATIGKMEDGKLKLIKQEISPDQLLKEALSSAKGLAALKKVKLVLEPPENPPILNIDRGLILRVLQNLLMNALSFSKHGTNIIMGCESLVEKKQLRFYVIDQGPGIPKEERLTIFEKYARLQDRQNYRTGTGLGLYFCKLAIEKHRGSISVENMPKGGSCFVFFLPCKPKDNEVTWESLL